MITCALGLCVLLLGNYGTAVMAVVALCNDYLIELNCGVVSWRKNICKRIFIASILLPMFFLVCLSFYVGMVEFSNHHHETPLHAIANLMVVFLKTIFFHVIKIDFA